MNKDVSTLTFQGETGRDEFQREQVADKVITLLTSDVVVSPMVIDGHWGTGKTEFCHKLINKFQNTQPDYHLLYVDAFQADHADNPLMTILAEVLNALPDGTDKESFLKKIIPVIRYGLKTALKASANHILRASSDVIADDLDKYIQDAADTAIDASVMAVLKDHEKAKESLEALQETLGELAKDNPIIIFVDELDRCRPDFSVQMLEVIKHTFDVEGVQFVLITNTIQLRAAINHRYGGTAIDAKRYLDKFLKFSFCLPDFIPSHERTKAAIAHFNNLSADKLTISVAGFGNSSHPLNEFATTLIEKNSLSLREVETFIRHLELYQTLCNRKLQDWLYGYNCLFVLGVYIFCFEPSIEAAIRSDKTDADKLVKLLGFEGFTDSKLLESKPDNNIDRLIVLLGSGSVINNQPFRDLMRTEEEFWKVVRGDMFTMRIAETDDTKFLESIKKVFDILSLSTQQ